MIVSKTIYSIQSDCEVKLIAAHVKLIAAHISQSYNAQKLLGKDNRLSFIGRKRQVLFIKGNN